MKRKHVGIAGALLASLSAFVGGFAFYYLTGQIVEKREGQQELLRQHARLWESHMLADSRQYHAEIISILATRWGDKELHALADRRFFDAWQTMGAATDGPFVAGEQQWGPLQPRDVRMGMIDVRRLRSAETISARNDEIRAIGKILGQLEGKARVVFYASLVFTCVGGIIAALKDLL